MSYTFKVVVSILVSVNLVDLQPKLVTVVFICLIILFSSRFSQTQRSPHVFYRHNLINKLQDDHSLVTLVAENIATYMNSMRLYSRGMYYKLTLTIGNHMGSSSLFLFVLSLHNLSLPQRWQYLFFICCQYYRCLSFSLLLPPST